MIRYLLITSLAVILTATQSFTQYRWVPLLQQIETKPTVNLKSSTSGFVHPGL